MSIKTKSIYEQAIILGQKLKTARENMGLSLAQVAETVGQNEWFLGEVEKGNATHPDIQRWIANLTSFARP